MATVQFDRFFNIIGGERVSSGQTSHGINPATLEPLAPVPLCTSEDVERAIAAAKRAAPGWEDTPLQKRQLLVSKYADALESAVDDFARMLVLECGKPMSVAMAEMHQAVEMLKGVASLPFPQDIIEDSADCHVFTRYVPIGVSVGIVPWNFPVVLASFKLGPALVAGNPIILKPSPFTPYCNLKLAELATHFFPPGIVQALNGDDSLGPMLTCHPGVDKVSFTGSIATGINVMKSAAQTLKRVTLELGGNDAAIVCKDVDIPVVATQVAALALYNSGQVCIAIKRVYVHSSIFEEFVSAMVNYVETLSLGNGLDKNTNLGPVQNAVQFAKVKDLATSIRGEGLDIATGDVEFSAAQEGYFMNPMIIRDPPDDSRVVIEEPFGPIFPVLQWSDEAEVIKRANNSDCGLGASVWSRDEDQADRLSKRLKAGNVWINSHMVLRPDASFSGHKSSGIGSELGVSGLKSYCNVQTIYKKKL